MTWTAAAIDTLRTMWANGASCSEIGAALNVSRSAIAGKIHRLKLPKKTKHGPRKADLRVGRVRSFPQQKHKRLPPMHIRIVTVPESRPVGLVERTGCCYPTTAEGPHLFCNEQTNGSDYCEFHHRLMYPKRRAA